MKYPNYETNTIEFKETIGKQNKISWLKKVCAMSNEILGGTIVIGVSDNGSIVGLDNTEEVISIFTLEVKNNIAPTVTFHLDMETYDAKEIVVVKVLQGNQPPYILKENNGRQIVYVMRGNTTEPANQNDYIQLALRATNLSWDTLDSMYRVDKLTFNSLFDKHKEVLGKELTEKDLSELGLVNSDIVTNVGVLLSDQNPNTDSWISVTRWPGLDKNASEGIIDKEVKGSIINQIDESYNFVMSLIRVEFSFNEKSPQRKNDYEYDFLALRETIINAITHRNYSIHNNQQIEVGVYDDRIEVKSTGSLLNGRTVDDLINLRTIGRRNATLCNIMRELGYIESRGRGMSKIVTPKTAWKKAPEFYSGNDFFMVTLYSRHYGKTISELPKDLNVFDDLGLKILKILKDKPTMTQRELAVQLSISRRTLTNRINSLYDNNVLGKEGTSQKKRYVVLVDID